MMKKTLPTLLLLTLLGGCQSEVTHSDSNATLNQSSQEKLLDAKHALLALDLNRVRALASHIDVNAPLPDKSSLLSWAVETQSPELVMVLLENGANVQSRTGNRFGPMIQACRYGNEAIIQALLDNGADLTSAIEDGTSALHLCAGTTSAPLLSKILDKGYNINATNVYGQSPLMFAANAGNSDNMGLLVKRGAKINQQTKEGYSPLFFAIKSKQLSAVTSLIDLGADLFHQSADGTTLTQLAVYTDNVEFLTWYAHNMPSLMSQEAIQAVITQYDRDGYQLLHKAVKANQPSLVSALLDLGANPHSLSEPSTLTWRYEANFKSENYIPPQLTPVQIAEKNKLSQITALLENSRNTI